MAVFTEVTLPEAQALADRLDLGPVQTLRGISAGIENTNYFLTTDGGEFVLTVFERLSFAQLPFYLQLMKHLAQRGLAVPDPQADAGGEILFELQGKPAAVVNKLRGGHQLAPDLFHCEQVGAELARMHLAAQDFPLHQDNLRGLSWWNETVPVVLPFLHPAQAELLSSELAFQQSLASSASFAELPRGPIHADLFRDNVMFEGLPGRERLSGCFDFYFAGVDSWLFDLAICLNDWCIDQANGRLDEARAEAFVRAYESVRPMSGVEHRLLPAMLRAGALRFWLSRLWDVYLPRDAALLKPHDPGHFERVLRERIARPWHALQPL
ncbi:MAG: homoserine kinase [Paucibacter sp.]|nr:homoserine kinase [Roseateles sp.]